MMPPHLRGEHRPADELGAEEDAGQIQVHHGAAILQRHLFSGDVFAPAADVVDEDVDRARADPARAAHPARVSSGEKRSADDESTRRPRASNS